MNREVAGHLAMLCFSALVAGSFALGVLIANQVSPLVVTTLRFIITVIFLGVIMMMSCRPERSFFRAPWRFVALGVCLAMYFIFMFEALKTAPAISLSVEFTLAPIISGIFGYFLLGQVFTRRVFFALCVGAIGALWVIFHGELSRVMSFQIGRGEVLFFIGMSFYALYAPLVRKLKRDEPSIVFTFAITLGALIITVPFAANEFAKTDLGDLDMQVWLVILYLAIFASAATFSLIQFAAVRLPSVKVMAHTYLIPSWVILWQLILGTGAPNTNDLVGVVLTLFALSLLLKSQDTTATLG